jgi:hypothetical protein
LILTVLHLALMRPRSADALKKDAEPRMNAAVKGMS